MPKLIPSQKHPRLYQICKHVSDITDIRSCNFLPAKMRRNFPPVLVLLNRVEIYCWHMYGITNAEIMQMTCYIWCGVHFLYTFLCFSGVTEQEKKKRVCLEWHNTYYFWKTAIWKMCGITVWQTTFSEDSSYNTTVYPTMQFAWFDLSFPVWWMNLKWYCI